MSFPTKQGVGNKKPPIDRQFGKPNGNPRHNGAWKKEDTPRFKLERMLKMTDQELSAVIKDKNQPLFDKRIASFIAKDDWKSLEAMINQVYGKPTERIEHKVVEPKPILDLTKI